MILAVQGALGSAGAHASWSRSGSCHDRWLSLTNHNTSITMISTRIIRSTHNGNFTPHPFLELARLRVLM
jgi:hypothetical protein